MPSSCLLRGSPGPRRVVRSSTTQFGGRLSSTFFGGRSEPEALAIRPVARALLVRIEPELGQRVAVTAVLVLGMLRQVATHALLGCRREDETKVAIDEPDGAEGIAHHIHVAHVEETVGGDDPLVADTQLAIKPVGPTPGHLRTDAHGIDLVAERAAERR